MWERLKVMVQSIRDSLARSAAGLGGSAADVARNGATRVYACLAGARGALIVLAVLGAAGYALIKHPPMQSVGRGEIGVRVNHVTGTVSEWGEGGVLVIPGLYEMRVFTLRDQTYRAVQASRAEGPAPVQSVEGLSLGIDLTIRYALDPGKVSTMAKVLPDNISADIVEPAVNGIIYRIFAGYTVREIFSTKRAEIQQAIEKELAPRLAADGVLLRTVQMGKVDLPADYRRGMEALLAEELASEKMRYTLELKEKHVKETQLEGEAQKVRREKAAEAAAREQIIAAKAQEEAMQHVLPLRERQIRQRQLEAEATNVVRIKGAEGNAQARKIEASGEAEARQKLADAEAYRLERVGKANAEQMGREGMLLSKHPLLIQKTLADKLSDKIQVIIAPPPADGGFIGATLVGAQKRAANAGPRSSHGEDSAANEERIVKGEQ
ncbi:MAG TPA: SPFH domain-containing protein [Burkholderiales bacterium]|nr:SPFH domain-containing protein [Burkholderiales bacterium]